jgi:hypothetical protein
MCRNRCARLVLYLAVLLCSLGCRQASSRSPVNNTQETLGPASVQGCYELTLSAWRPTLSLGSDERELTLPPKIQLFGVRGTKGWETEGYVVKPAPGIEDAVHRESYWNTKGPRSIEIVWTSGFSGVVMSLKVDAAGLSGQAKSFSDSDRQQTQNADVVARKFDCTRPGDTVRSEPATK